MKKIQLYIYIVLIILALTVILYLKDESNKKEAGIFASPGKECECVIRGATYPLVPVDPYYNPLPPTDPVTGAQTTYYPFSLTGSQIAEAIVKGQITYVDADECSSLQCSEEHSCAIYLQTNENFPGTEQVQTYQIMGFCENHG